MNPRTPNPSTWLVAILIAIHAGAAGIANDLQAPGDEIQRLVLVIGRHVGLDADECLGLAAGRAFLGMKIERPLAANSSDKFAN